MDGYVQFETALSIGRKLKTVEQLSRLTMGKRRVRMGFGDEDLGDGRFDPAFEAHIGVIHPGAVFETHRRLVAVCG